MTHLHLAEEPTYGPSIFGGVNPKDMRGNRHNYKHILKPGYTCPAVDKRCGQNLRKTDLV